LFKHLVCGESEGMLILFSHVFSACAQSGS
jgi:hypothetical protein